MGRLFRFLVFVALLLVFIWFGMTVKLGNHTLFGHFKRIWRSDETQDLVKGTKDAAKPAVEKVKRAVEDTKKGGE